MPFRPSLDVIRNGGGSIQLFKKALIPNKDATSITDEVGTAVYPGKDRCGDKRSVAQLQRYENPLDSGLSGSAKR